MDYRIYTIFGIILGVVLIIAFILERKNNLKKRNEVLSDLAKQKEEFEKYKASGKKLSNINEWSYQRFCNFFDNIQLKDEKFDSKIDIILDLIVNKKETDLLLIQEASGCDYTELILKIMYLKNKRLIGDLYIDKGDNVIRKCSKEDQELLEKYSKYIYDYHMQPYEIAAKLPGASLTNMDFLANKVLEELEYLDDKYLINGINIDKVDKKIIYYTIEKHKKAKNFISINCNNCGALCDVPKKGKARCKYCNSIVVDSSIKE